jgi:hypothetical protein
MIVHVSRGAPYFHTEHDEEQPRTWVLVRPPGSVSGLGSEPVEVLLDTGSQWSYIPAWAAEGYPVELPPELA